MPDKNILQLIYKIESFLTEASVSLNELRSLVLSKPEIQSDIDQLEQQALQDTIVEDPLSWPKAADPNAIIYKTDTIKRALRAVQIISIINPKNKTSILDFGCGDGYVAKELSHVARSVVGYDIVNSQYWDNHIITANTNNLQLTVDKNVVAASAPYDKIVLYDVLDHIESDDPINVLKYLKTLLAKNGNIFIRTHPWISRHGGHLYENGKLESNKAFLHLTMTEPELIAAGYSVMPNLKVIKPLATYNALFEKAGLNIISKKSHTMPVEQYVIDNLLNTIMKVVWGDDITPETATQILSNVFIDYTLC